MREYPQPISINAFSLDDSLYSLLLTSETVS